MSVLVVDISVLVVDISVLVVDISVLVVDSALQTSIHAASSSLKLLKPFKTLKTSKLLQRQSLLSHSTRNSPSTAYTIIHPNRIRIHPYRHTYALTIISFHTFANEEIE